MAPNYGAERRGRYALLLLGLTGLLAIALFVRQFYFIAARTALLKKTIAHLELYRERNGQYPMDSAKDDWRRKLARFVNQTQVTKEEEAYRDYCRVAGVFNDTGNWYCFTDNVNPRRAAVVFCTERSGENVPVDTIVVEDNFSESCHRIAIGSAAISRGGNIFTIRTAATTRAP